ncbi:MAG: T9SS type A sorting domain-containing protein [Chitinophagaceae bacterium]|nr:T9SS type A sorting domain-containing protein [Chitinophagaceae bacterium]
MKKKLHTVFLLLFFGTSGALAQICDSLTAVAVTAESRCAATGKIIITASKGSGVYNYAVAGPVSTPYTSSDTIEGLPAGIYQVFVRDVINNCFFSISDVRVAGSYQDPRFELLKTDVTCINGTNGSITVNNVQFGREPFQYSIVAPSTYGVGTVSDSGVFNNLPAGNYFIQQRDSCGGIQTRNISILNYNWFIDIHTVTRTDCDSAEVFIGLKDIYGKVNTADSVFDGYVYGVVTPAGDTIFSSTFNFKILLGNTRRLSLFAIDKCGNIKTINWVENKQPRVATSVSELNKTCANFSAVITGQQNLTNPIYCLYDSLNNLISCNSSGQFDSLAYGAYCIRITDVCYDTVINRCFNALKPVPNVAASVTVTYGDDCNIVTVSIGSQTNLFNPQFCLYDSLDVLIDCNSTGTFGNIPIGRYCMKITGSICNDTTLIRCFEVVPLPVGPGTGPEFSNFTCSAFTGRITGTVGLGNATYCLYNSNNVLLSCNTTGVFDSLAFGSYCITIQVSRLNGGCADTIFPRCFTVVKPVPSVGGVEFTKTCLNFTAKISSVENMFNPQYCLFKDSVLISCNTTGIFENLKFGAYCIAVKDSCTDSTITRCFTVEPDKLKVNAAAEPSCNLGETRITGAVTEGIAPFSIAVYDAADSLLNTIITGDKNFSFDSLPGLAGGKRYRIMIVDNCNDTVSLFIEPIVSTFTKTIAVTRNCPGGSFTQGSSDIQLTLTSNLAKVFPVIIKKNGAPVNISYSFSNTAQTIFTFKNTEPGVYIIRSSINNSCNIRVFDTVTITSYQYPSLQNSTLYRCDDNSFNVTAVTTGGIAPNMYEITGSIPSFPSIVTAPQTSNIFSINNGNAYSLVRLRVLDACGNASINDISLVPLVNVVVTATGGCFNEDVTMRVDPVAGATYSWYKKTSATDSVLIGSSNSYYIPVVTPADTAMYLCKVVLNNSCIVRHAYFRLTGFCLTLLDNPVVQLSASKRNDEIQLNWTIINEAGVKEYILERKNNQSNFTAIHKQTANGNAAGYTAKDAGPFTERNSYRIKVIKENDKVYYSNIVTVRTGVLQNSVSVYPNPVRQQINVQLNNTWQHDVSWKLLDVNGKVILENRHALLQQQFRINRPPGLNRGMYLLHITDIRTNTTVIKKLIFE